MTNSEKIASKQEQVKKSEERITAEQAKIEKLKQEIETLQSLEIKGLLKEIDLPFEEVKKMLKGLKG